MSHLRRRAPGSGHAEELAKIGVVDPISERRPARNLSLVTQLLRSAAICADNVDAFLATEHVERDEVAVWRPGWAARVLSLKGRQLYARVPSA